LKSNTFLNSDDGNYQRSNRYSYTSYRENLNDKYNNHQFQNQVDLKGRLQSINQNRQEPIIPKSTNWINRTSSFSYTQSVVTSKPPKYNLSNEIEDIGEEYDEKIVVRHTFDNHHPLERFGKLFVDMIYFIWHKI
jgi:hypothetical protein